MPHKPSARFAPALGLFCILCSLVAAQHSTPPEVGFNDVLRHPGASADHNPSALISLYVVLEGDGAVKASLDAPIGARLKAAHDRLAAISAQQDALMPRLKALGAVEIFRFRRLINAIQVIAPADLAPALAALPGVVRVEPVPIYELSTATSVPYIGAPNLWDSAQLNLHGEGIRLGIIDTGVDYLHANFGGTGNPADYTANDRTIIEPGTFPTARVVGGTDLCGDAYNATSSNPANNTPFPDPDPLDCNGHGSHVAGIAAGSGVLTNGATFTGPYGPGLEPAQFLIGPGVAPMAQIYAIKVFGCEGSTALVGAALEWAADPNDDMDFSDHLDVVNLSIGSNFGALYFTEGDIIKQLTALGCSVVASAGNSGNTFYITGGVGTAPESLSVAAITDTDLTFNTFQITSPPSIAGSYQALEGSVGFPLSQYSPFTATVAMAEPSLACTALSNPGDISGRIALVDRGTCSFRTKVLNAQDAGAMAVLIVNNNEGLPTAPNGSNNGITIPALMISKTDGDLIKAHLNEGVVIWLEYAPVPRPDLAGQIMDFSSRGPHPLAPLLKPDIAAPGYSIASTLVGSGTGYQLQSGTSMASPHVAGAMALLRQSRPDAPVAELKARVINTAGDVFYLSHRTPESRTGAGRLRTDKAADIPVTAANADDPAQVSVSWGFQRLAEPFNDTRRIRLTNHSAVPHTYSAAIVSTVEEGGVAFTVDPPQITVPANGTALATLHLTATPALFDRTSDPSTTPQYGRSRASLFEASGLVTFTEGADQLHVPFYGAFEAAARRQAPPIIYLGTSTTGIEVVSIPLSGPSAHPNPLVSALPLGLEHPNGQFSDPLTAAVDLLAAGVGSNAGAVQNFNDATLFFGIVTAGERVAPSFYFGDVEFFIDLGLNGTYEYNVYPSDYGTLNFGAPTDTFISVVYNRITFTHHEAGPLNGLAPDVRETAPWYSRVLLFTVPVSFFGLTPSASSFNYLIGTYRLANVPAIDVSDVATFDLAVRPIDPSPHGLNATPLFETATPSIQVTVDRAQLAANPSKNKLLLLHHHNVSSMQYQIVEFRLEDPPPTPDGWMLTDARSAHFPLSRSAASGVR
ncbi:MAG: S8 family serine peptidase [Candidatus Sumerlaeia bacterium]